MFGIPVGYLPLLFDIVSGCVVLLLFFVGVRVVRPTSRGLVERLGKYPIQLVNEAADKFFVGNAQLLRKLITLENSLSANTKFVVPSNAELVSIIGDMAGILPISRAPSKP